LKNFAAFTNRVHFTKRSFTVWAFVENQVNVSMAYAESKVASLFLGEGHFY